METVNLYTIKTQSMGYGCVFVIERKMTNINRNKQNIKCRILLDRR